MDVIDTTGEEIPFTDYQYYFDTYGECNIVTLTYGGAVTGTLTMTDLYEIFKERVLAEEIEQ